MWHSSRHKRTISDLDAPEFADTVDCLQALLKREDPRAVRVAGLSDLTKALALIAKRAPVEDIGDFAVEGFRLLSSAAEHGDKLSSFYVYLIGTDGLFGALPPSQKIRELAATQLQSEPAVIHL